ncbi:hypothetical protein [Serratia marcescens]|uniref:hypothetical protein n=1 Tax=Serratia marcescens TaxID=615 RepID=UPI003D00FE4B
MNYSKRDDPRRISDSQCFDIYGDLYFTSDRHAKNLCRNAAQENRAKPVTARLCGCFGKIEVTAKHCEDLADDLGRGWPESSKKPPA